MSSQKQVLFDAFPKQIEFLEAVFSKKYRVILYGGAIRGGKTFAGLGALILLCKGYPKSRWAVVRDSLPTLKRNTIPSWEKIRPTNFIQSYNQETQVVTFNNGSQIIFFPENYDMDKELDRWKGLEVNGFLLEEANELQIKSFYKAIERAGSNVIDKKPPPLVMLTCNPNNSWVKTLIYDPWKEGTLPDAYRYIPSRIFDNPYVASDDLYMESLKLMPKYEYEVFVEGNWDIKIKTGDEYVHQFNYVKHVVSCKYDPNEQLHLAFDFNAKPHCTCVAAQVHVDHEQKRITLRFIRSFPSGPDLKRSNTEDLCEDIMCEFGNHKAGVFYYGDSTGENSQTVSRDDKHNYAIIDRVLFSILNEDSSRLRRNPPIIARRNFLNKLFYGMEFFDGYSVFIEIDPGNDMLIDDVSNLKAGPDGKKYKEITVDPQSKVSYQKWGHGVDCAEYLCVGVLPEYFETVS